MSHLDLIKLDYSGFQIMKDTSSLLGNNMSSNGEMSKLEEVVVRTSRYETGKELKKPSPKLIEDLLNKDRG